MSINLLLNVKTENVYIYLLVHVHYIPFCIHSFSAFVNILSLILSAPFLECEEEDEGRCDELFTWFVVITCIDFILSVVNTLKAIARIEYAVYLHVHKDQVSGTITSSDGERFFSSFTIGFLRLQTPEEEEHNFSTYTAWYRLITLILVTVGLWWSVAIGVRRVYIHS